MIEIMKDVPANIIAAKTSGTITKDDYDRILMPAMDAQAEKHDKLNLLMYITNDVSNFTIGAWWNDVKQGLKNITKWHRTAIVIDQKSVRTFTDAFSKVFPGGEFKGFPLEEFEEAKKWVSSE